MGVWGLDRGWVGECGEGEGAGLVCPTIYISF